MGGAWWRLPLSLGRSPPHSGPGLRPCAGRLLICSHSFARVGHLCELVGSRVHLWGCEWTAWPLRSSLCTSVSYREGFALCFARISRADEGLQRDLVQEACIIAGLVESVFQCVHPDGSFWGRKHIHEVAQLHRRACPSPRWADTHVCSAHPPAAAGVSEGAAGILLLTLVSPSWLPVQVDGKPEENQGQSRSRFMTISSRQAARPQGCHSQEQDEGGVGACAIQEPGLGAVRSWRLNTPNSVEGNSTARRSSAAWQLNVMIWEHFP